jgi:hypothetical protein
MIIGTDTNSYFSISFALMIGVQQFFATTRGHVDANAESEKHCSKKSHIA